MKISKTGYKKNSKDKNQESLLIPSGRITMKDVEFPVLGTDNYGNQQMMYPGKEYLFPGDYVYERPMKTRLNRYANGGASCPDGYQWDATLERCVKVYTSYDDYKKALERYELNKFLYEDFKKREQLRNSFINQNNLESYTKFNDDGTIRSLGFTYPTFEYGDDYDKHWPDGVPEYIISNDGKQIKIDRDAWKQFSVYPDELADKYDSFTGYKMSDLTPSIPTRGSNLRYISEPEPIKFFIPEGAKDNELTKDQLKYKYGPENVFIEDNIVTNPSTGAQKIIGHRYQIKYPNNNGMPGGSSGWRQGKLTPEQQAEYDQFFLEEHQKVKDLENRKLGGSTGWLDKYPLGGPAFDPKKIAEGVQKARYQNALDWHEDWMNSPKYKEMLYKDGSNSKDSSLVDRTRKNNLSQIRKQPLNISYEDYPNMRAMYSPDNKNVTLYTEGWTKPTVLTHEVGHAVDLNHLDPSALSENKDKLTMPQEDINFITNQRFPRTTNGFFISPEGIKIDRIDPSFRTAPLVYPIPEKYVDFGDQQFRWTMGHPYFTRPTEVRSRLSEIRQYSQDNGVYDPFTQDAPKSVLDINHPAMQELKSYYSDDDIIKMLNRISYNNNNSDQTGVYQSKFGGVAKYPKGGPTNNVPTVKVRDEKGQITEMRIDDPKYRELYPSLVPGGIDPVTGRYTLYGGLMEPLVFDVDGPNFFEKMWNNFTDSKYYPGNWGSDKSNSNQNVNFSKTSDQGSQDQDKVHWYETLNYKNWGLNDYSDHQTFNSAFKTARESGDKEFMWNDKRYTTDLIPEATSNKYWDAKRFLQDYYTNENFTPLDTSPYNLYDFYDNYTKNKYGYTWSEYYDKIKNTPEYLDPNPNPTSDKYQDTLNLLDKPIFYSQYSDEAKTALNNYSRDKYIKALNDPSYYFSITSQPDPKNPILGYQDSKQKKFYVSDTGTMNDFTTFVHELSHKGDSESRTDYYSKDSRIPEIDIDRINKFGTRLDQERFNYVSDPSETEARKMSTLYYMDRVLNKNIKSGQIKKEDLQELYNTYNAEGGYNQSKSIPIDIQDLLELYKWQQDDLLKYLNNDFSYIKPEKQKLGGSNKLSDKYDNGALVKPRTVKVDFGNGRFEEYDPDSNEYNEIYNNIDIDSLSKPFRRKN